MQNLPFEHYSLARVIVTGILPLAAMTAFLAFVLYRATRKLAQRGVLRRAGLTAIAAVVLFSIALWLRPLAETLAGVRLGPHWQAVATALISLCAWWFLLNKQKAD